MLGWILQIMQKGFKENLKIGRQKKELIGIRQVDSSLYCLKK